MAEACPSPLSTGQLRTVTSQRLSPLGMLPFEIWATIIDLASTQPHNLLTIAATCEDFAAICVRLYLHRQGFTEDRLSDTDLLLPSEILEALVLHVPRKTLPARRLVCQINYWNIPRLLRGVSKVSARCADLAELSLFFSENLFSMRRDDHRVTLQAFSRSISTVSQRMPGPLFVLSEGWLLSSRLEDISHWQLHAYQYTAPSRRLNTLCSLPSVLQTQTGATPRYTGIQYHDGTAGSALTLRELVSGTLQFITANNSCTLLTLNSESMSHLFLGDPDGPVTSHLSTLLPHIRLPSLSTLYLCTDTVTPRALREFLERHPSLTRVEFEAHSSLPAEQPDTQTRALVNPPLTHPGLQTIKTSALRLDVPAAVAPDRLTCGLVGSPCLRRFEFELYENSTAEGVAWMLRDLRLVAALPPMPDGFCLRFELAKSKAIKMSPYLTPPDSESLHFWADSMEALQVAQMLSATTSSVEIVAHSVDIARRMFPWLKTLAVRDILFVLFLHERGKQTEYEAKREKERLEEDFRVALPAVGNVRCEIYCE